MYYKLKSGRKTFIRKLIQTEGRLCKCIEQPKYLYAFNSSAELLSYNSRMSKNILTSLGGKIHFGNYYLGKPNVFNYLGRQEGQPGGGGIPIRNHF